MYICATIEAKVFFLHQQRTKSVNYVNPYFAFDAYMTYHRIGTKLIWRRHKMLLYGDMLVNETGRKEPAFCNFLRMTIQ